MKAIGEEKLGFTAKDVGTHSIRTSFATLLYLKKAGPILIQIGGRWKSTAFLNTFDVIPRRLPSQEGSHIEEIETSKC